MNVKLNLSNSCHDTTGRLDFFSSAGSQAWDNRNHHIISLKNPSALADRKHSSVENQQSCKRHSILTESSPANCSTSRVENTPSLSLSNTWKICNQTRERAHIETFQGYSLFMYLFLFTQGTVKFVLHISWYQRLSKCSPCTRVSNLGHIYT